MNRIKKIAIGTLALGAFTAAAWAKMEYAGSTLWTRINHLKISGNHAYCSFANGLAVLDIRDKKNIKLVSQLFGDRAIIANATGCSSIYGGNLPTTPWAKNKDGRGPTWSNSLFEDNAEFGLGFRLTIDKRLEYASELLPQVANVVGADLVDALLKADQSSEAGILQQRGRVQLLKEKLQGNKSPLAQELLSIADVFVSFSPRSLVYDSSSPQSTPPSRQKKVRMDTRTRKAPIPSRGNELGFERR